MLAGEGHAPAEALAQKAAQKAKHSCQEVLLEIIVFKDRLRVNILLFGFGEF